MERNKKEKMMYLIIAILTLVVIIGGISYAFFSANITTINEENNQTKVIAKALVDVTMEYGGIIESNGALPGYKVVKTIHVVGSGPADAEAVTINLTLTPNVIEFKDHVKYSIYAVENSNIGIEEICEGANQVVESGKYYDDMQCDVSALGEVIKSGIFVDKKVIRESVTVEYDTDRTYYILIEYLNDEEKEQNSEQGRSFTVNLGYEEGNQTFSDYIVNQAKKDNAIEEFNHEATEQTPALTDYRYVGADPKNYVYFGCEGNSCTEDNLYRIIGFIPTQSSENGEYENRLKLIKANYYTENESGLLLPTHGSYPVTGGYGYQWTNNTDNKWEESTLQNQVLNGVYWNSLGEYKNYISPAVWYLGTPSGTNYGSHTPDYFYTTERSDSSRGATYLIANIGLIYPSDYGYSIGVDYRELSVSNYKGEYVKNAWLFNKSYDWTISAVENDNWNAWNIFSSAELDWTYSNSRERVWGIRPTFYLKADVQYASGTGSIMNPYRIK